MNGLICALYAISMKGNLCRSFMSFFLQGAVNASEFVIKSCASPDDCIQGSVNFGDFRTVTVSQCCDTDLCNNQPAPGKVSVS